MGASPTCHPRHSEQGFTLFEMLVTIAIMGLIAGIGFPAVQRLSARQDFTSAADAVMLALVEARADAVSGDRAVRVQLGADRASLLLSSRRAPVTLEGGVSIDWPGQGLAFFPDGTASGGAVAVTLGGWRRRFAIDRYTGRIAAAA